MSARLFAAVELPGHVRDALAAWAREAAGTLDALRLVPAEDLHLTLVFLGARSEEDAPRIGGLVTACAAGGCELVVGDLLWLAPRRPHVLTVAIESPGGALGRLQGAVEEALVEGAGHRPEPRAFRPHVTVGRVRRGARLRGADLALDPPPPRIAFAAEALALLRTRSGAGGSRYEPVARASLG